MSGAIIRLSTQGVEDEVENLQGGRQHGYDVHGGLSVDFWQNGLNGTPVYMRPAGQGYVTEFVTQGNRQYMFQAALTGNRFQTTATGGQGQPQQLHYTRGGFAPFPLHQTQGRPPELRESSGSESSEEEEEDLEDDEEEEEEEDEATHNQEGGLNELEETQREQTGEAMTPEEEARAANANGVPSEERKKALLLIAVDSFVGGISQGTKNLYGDIKDPLTGTGYAGEFAKWCRASSNQVFNGVKTSPQKEVYLVPLPCETVVLEYFRDHFLKRKQYDRKTRSYIIDKPHSGSSIDNCLKALKKMYDYQAKLYPGGPTAYAKDRGRRPNDGGTIKTLRNAYLRSAREARKRNYSPRGLGTLVMEGYTDDQNRQVCEFGLSNDSLCTHNLTRMPHAKARQVHTHHVVASNFCLRFDDRKHIQWSQFCLEEPPDRMKEEGKIKLLTCVLEDRKTNQYGNHEKVSSLRHREDPLKCTFFALGLELYSQVQLDGLPFPMDDFIPRRQEGSTNFVHRWYDRYLFHGHTKATRGRTPQPDPFQPCSYPGVLKAFNQVYEQVSPPITTYHKLHLQRGRTVREAEKGGVETHQIGSHGGWNLRSALHQHYLTGAPMEMIRFLAGYDPKLTPGDKIPCIRRGLCDPPTRLRDKVFPFVNQLKRLMQLSPQEFDTDGRSTLEGFIALCEMLSVTFLQDCAVLYEDMSQHPIFSTPLLASPEFFSFRDKLLNEMQIYESTPSEDRTLVDGKSSDCLKVLTKLYALACDWGGRFLGCKVQDKELNEMIQKMVLKEGMLDGAVMETERSSPVSLRERDNGTPQPTRISPPGITTANPPTTGTTMQDLFPTEPELTHFGEKIPDILQNTILPATSPSGSDLHDPSTWPRVCPPPQWATSRWLFNKPDSVDIVVDEYMKGYPSPPALYHLEKLYGPDAIQITKGSSWRSDPNRNEANRRRKAWSERRALYDRLDHILAKHVKDDITKLRKKPDETLEEIQERERVKALCDNQVEAAAAEAKQDLSEYIQKEFHSLIPEGMDARKPGHAVVRKMWLKMKKDTDGDGQRKERAIHAAKKRKLNREERENSTGSEQE